MKILPKCDYCNKPLSMNNSVFTNIDRYDEFGVHITKLIFCCECWDSIKIMKDGKDIFNDQ